MKSYSDLKARVIAHTISFFIIILLILFSLLCPFRPLMTLIISIIGLIALCEFYKLVKKKGYPTATLLACFFSFIYLHVSLLARPIAPYVLAIALLAFFLSFCFKKESIIGIATTFFGMIYIIVPLGMLVHIGSQFKGPSNAFWLGFLILVTKSADMGGYFIGRTWGRHKLAKKLSPNKTVEGALGAIISAILMSLLLKFIDATFFSLVNDFSYLWAIVLGFIMAIFAMMGDLAESLLKRDAHVKDSNNIPGIGGILDVIDALLFTTPVLYLFLKFHYAS